MTKPVAPSSEASEAGHNLPEFSVAEISAALRKTLETTYGRVRVRGEVSGLMRAGSGHVYFTVKDENAVLDAVCWRGTANRLTQQPEDGLEIVCTGKISAYAGRSKYQIIVEDVELAGEGALLRLLEERRKKLAAEGLFDADHKRPLPFLPNVIGVVTSPTGAVIRDILHRLEDRFPRHVLLWPVLVQGEGAATQISAAIAGFNAIGPDGPVPRPDVLIVARGGGSLEDLMAFNEEAVVRAAAASEIPLISAVGHETDTTLIDYAADRRAPTPTAAAEMAVPVRAELLAQVHDDGQRLIGAMDRRLRELRTGLDAAGRGLPALPRLVAEKEQRFDEWGERLVPALSRFADRRRQDLNAAARAFGQLVRSGLSRHALEFEHRSTGLRPERLEAVLSRKAEQLRAVVGLLESYSYRSVLERGFALVRDASGTPVKTAATVAEGATLAIEFQDGAIEAVAGPGGSPTKPRKPKGGKAAKPSGTGQGSLF